MIAAIPAATIATTILEDIISDQLAFLPLTSIVPGAAKAIPLKIFRKHVVIVRIEPGYLNPHRTCCSYGRGLAKSAINKAGDFIFIPADVPHQPDNRSAEKPARATVARNDPDEQESVVPYDPEDGRPNP